MRPGRTRVEADQSTAVVGRALTFTGGGFEPGEQVVAVLDDGLAALGPLRAGESGEVAGVLPLPAETSVGTHVLRLEGAASGSRAVDRFPVTAPTAVPVAEVGEEPVGLLFGLLSGQGTSAGGALAGPVSFAGSALVLVVAVVLAALRRRRASREPAPGPVVA
ncbi:hypothetical protein NOCARDAX2BIS_550002 [Nocardioides sp. AX2bis]|nr:hypothetical protein NOCARDAX2BIS_550002 [Nocardioides sp. AX2bis]